MYVCIRWYTCVGGCYRLLVSEESDDLIASNEGVNDDGNAMSADYSSKIAKIVGTK